MQRLISLYPRGWPGVGLILLRLAAGLGLLLHNPVALLDLPPGATYFITGIIALCLLGGMLSSWMAFACCVTALFGLSVAASISLMIFGLCSAALLMVGPGAYSMDGIIFGRRVIRIPD